MLLSEKGRCTAVRGNECATRRGNPGRCHAGFSPGMMRFGLLDKQEFAKSAFPNRSLGTKRVKPASLVLRARNPIPRHQERPRRNRHTPRRRDPFSSGGRCAASMPAGPRKSTSRVAAGNARPEGIAQRTGKELVQLRMQKSARGQAVVDVHDDDPPGVSAARTH